MKDKCFKTSEHETFLKNRFSLKKTDVKQVPPNTLPEKLIIKSFPEEWIYNYVFYKLFYIAL